MATRYNFRSTAAASGVHAATVGEFALDTSTGTTAGTSVSFAGIGARDAFLYTTASGVPGLGTWPSDTYGGVLSVTSAGGNMTIGVLTSAGGTGHMGRVDSGLTSDLETKVQSQAAFAGTGLKSYSNTWTPSAGSTTDRLEVLVSVFNSSTCSQTLSMAHNDGSSYIDFPTASGTTTTQQVTATQAQSASLAKTPTKVASTSQASSASILRQITRVPVATQASTATLRRTATRLVTATQAQTPTLAASRLAIKIVTATQASAATLRLMPTKVLTATQSATASARVTTTKRVTATQSATASVPRRITRLITAAQSEVATLTPAVTHNQIVTATQASVATLRKTPSKVASASQAVTGFLTRLITKRASATQPVIVPILRTPANHVVILTATQASSADLTVSSSATPVADSDMLAIMGVS